MQRVVCVGKLRIKGLVTWIAVVSPTVCSPMSRVDSPLEVEEQTVGETTRSSHHGEGTCDIFSFVSLARTGVWLLFHGLLNRSFSLFYIIREFDWLYMMSPSIVFCAFINTPCQIMGIWNSIAESTRWSIPYSTEWTKRTKWEYPHSLIKEAGLLYPHGRSLQ